MKIKLVNLLLVVSFFLFGCEQNNDSASYSTESVISVSQQQQSKNKYLAYSHSVSVELSFGDIKTRYNQLLTWCTNDQKFKCTLLSSSLNTNGYVQANLRFRIIADGISPLLDMASKGGSTTSQSTSVEDLGDSIVDNQKRLEMLRGYRERLEEINQQPKQNIEALVKIASELAQVQSDIEYAEGKRAKLLKRVEMDVLNLQLFASGEKSFFSPIGESLEDFGGDLSEGISNAITALAYIIPCSLILALVIYLLRKLWFLTRSVNTK